MRLLSSFIITLFLILSIISAPSTYVSYANENNNKNSEEEKVANSNRKDNDEGKEKKNEHEEKEHKNNTDGKANENVSEKEESDKFDYKEKHDDEDDYDGSETENDEEDKNSKNNEDRDNKEHDNEGHCTYDDFAKVESAPYTTDAPGGKVISKIYVKAGSSKNGFGCFEYTQDKNDGCYDVKGIHTSVGLVTKVGSGNTCKDISHVSFVAGDPGTTPIPPRVTSTPTPTPTPTGTVTTVTPTLTVTVTSTPIVVSTVTPTPTVKQEEKKDNKSGDVLGISTLPDTGDFMNGLWKLFQLSGIITCAVALALIFSNLEKNTKSKINLIMKELGIFFIGSLLFISSTLGKNSLYPTAPFTKTVAAYEKPLEFRVFKLLYIPALSLNANIEKGGIINNKWILSAKNVLYYPLDNKSSNSLLYAHNRPELFGNLKNLKEGDTIYLTDLYNKTYTYRVYEKEYIKFSNVEKIKTNEENVITLFTCDGIFDQFRLLVRARLVLP